MVRHYSFTTFLKYNFCERYFVIVLYVLFLFLSFIAKGLSMCRLGGETALSPLPKGKVFAMIAKFTMHSEIAAPLFLIQTTSFCIIPILSLL